jgi:RNA:NAD 2'-phosphotransferase (TPT1/KptA family)
MQVAAAAAASCGVSAETGRAWMDAAKAGDISTLSAMLRHDPVLLSYKVSSHGVCVNLLIVVLLTPLMLIQ